MFLKKCLIKYSGQISPDWSSCEAVPSEASGRAAVDGELRKAGQARNAPQLLTYLQSKCFVGKACKAARFCSKFFGGTRLDK